jgi:hypothetical protein
MRPVMFETAETDDGVSMTARIGAQKAANWPAIPHSSATIFRSKLD